jgi:hypothetical protein
MVILYTLNYKFCERMSIMKKFIIDDSIYELFPTLKSSILD